MYYQGRPSNYFSHCKAGQKKTVAISQMFNHVQLHTHWMHLLNTRLCRYTYVVYCDQDRYVKKLINVKMDYTLLKSGVLLINFGHKLLFS